ncbi:PH domain-containing protein [Rossellomorea marisflavi]|uniref:PH domain-containing protein n=1 Tax=Rossellomorea marisflavi TaxID=189381 RepID=UPI00345A89DB
MYINIEEPTKKIAKDAVKMWRLTNTIGHGVSLILIAALVYCTDRFHWYGWIEPVLYILGGILIFSALYSISLDPIFVQRHWRYQIDEEFIQLKNGKWNTQHVVIPMAKVEYVRTEQGPFLRKYGLYDLEVGTTTSNHTIPAIPQDEAERLKAFIATYAKVRDEEEQAI